MVLFNLIIFKRLENLTFNESLQKVASIDGIRIKFKQIGTEMVFIFWNGHYPIASAYTKTNHYNVGYPKLLEMDLEHILLLNDWLYDYNQTDLTKGEIPF